jgi:hypothetical protein
MKHADLLAALRKPRSDEQIRECIEALAVPLHATDPVCVILDTAIADLLGYEDAQREAYELAKDDLDRWRIKETAELDARHHAEALAVRSIGVSA